MKKWIKMAVMAIIMFLACFSTGCSCESPKYKVSINFINAEDELGLESYVEEVSYGMSVPLELFLPAGYDHTKIRFGLEDKEITIDDWEVNFGKTLPEDEKQYEYSIDKTLKYTISFVTKDIVFNIDMSEAGKETFNITIDNVFANSYFQGVAISEDSLDRLIVLDKNNSKMLPRKNNNITARYGDYVALIYNRTKNQLGYQLNQHNNSVETLYGDVLHFTDSTFKRTEGKLTYTEYPIASKGNTRYYYDGDSNNNIFYIGQVKEDMNIYTNIPKFQPKLGFDLKEDYNMETPNTFYLLSNSNDYTEFMKDIKNETEETINRTISTPISIDLYRKSSVAYDANNKDMDKINDSFVIEKVTPSSDMTRLYNRYDGYKLYIGDGAMLQDNLLSVNDKRTTAEEYYIHVNFDTEIYDAVKNHIKRLRIKELQDDAVKWGYAFDEASAEAEAIALAESTYLERTQSFFRYQIVPYENFDLDALNSSMKVDLLENCNTFETTGNKYPSLVSVNGNYYVKVNKELLAPYILDRSYVDDYTAYDYKTGTAILYVSFHISGYDDIDSLRDHNFSDNREYFSRITLACNFLSDSIVNANDYRIHAYIDYEKNGKYYRDFGFVDYLIGENTCNVTLYFKTSLLVDENGMFRDNYYVYLMGTKYLNFTTPMVTQITYFDSKGILDDAKDPVPARQDKANSLHGIASFKLNFNESYPSDPTKPYERYDLDEYGCQLNINVQHKLASNYQISFKNCEMLATTQDSLYVTNKADFDELIDFTKINSVIKMEDNLAQLGSTADLYYFIEGDKDFDIYLDPTNKNTCITTTKTLCDITGKPITIDLGFGKPREIKVKYLIPVYELYEISDDGYYFFAV